MLSAQPGLFSKNEEIWGPFNCFSVKGAGGSPTGPDTESSVGDQGIGSLGRSVSSGLQMPVTRDIVVQLNDALGQFPAVFFLQNVVQLNQQK
jgi:hypothetical protein